MGNWGIYCWCWGRCLYSFKVITVSFDCLACSSLSVEVAEGCRALVTSREVMGLEEGVPANRQQGCILVGPVLWTWQVLGVAGLIPLVRWSTWPRAALIFKVRRTPRGHLGCDSRMGMALSTSPFVCKVILGEVRCGREEANKRYINEQDAAMENLGSIPLGGLWETLENTPQNCSTEEWGRWGICPPTPHPSLVEGAPGVLVTQHLQAAPCMDQTCCWGWKMLTSGEMQEATEYMGTFWGTCREAEQVGLGATSICSALLPHLSHRDLLYLFYALASCVHFFKAGVPGL